MLGLPWRERSTSDPSDSSSSKTFTKPTLFTTLCFVVEMLLSCQYQTGGFGILSTIDRLAS